MGVAEDGIILDMRNEPYDEEKEQGKFWVLWIVAIALACLVVWAIRDDKPRNYGDYESEFEHPDFH